MKDYLVLTPAGVIETSAIEALEYKKLYGYPYVVNRAKNNESKTQDNERI